MDNTRTAAMVWVIIFCLIGAVALVVAGLIDKRFAKNCKYTQGQITKVVESNQNIGRSSYKVTLVYSVNGKEYTAIARNSSRLYVGPIWVYYNPAKPGDGRLSKPKSSESFVAAFALFIYVIIFGVKVKPWRIGGRST